MLLKHVLDIATKHVLKFSFNGLILKLLIHFLRLVEWCILQPINCLRDKGEKRKYTSLVIYIRKFNRYLRRDYTHTEKTKEISRWRKCKFESNTYCLPTFESRTSQLLVVSFFINGIKITILYRNDFNERNGTSSEGFFFKWISLGKFIY